MAQLIKGSLKNWRSLALVQLTGVWHSILISTTSSSAPPLSGTLEHQHRLQAASAHVLHKP